MKPMFIVTPTEDGDWEAYTVEYRRSAVGYGVTPVEAIERCQEIVDACAEEFEGIESAAYWFENLMASMWNVCSKRKEKPGAGAHQTEEKS